MPWPLPTSAVTYCTTDPVPLTTAKWQVRGPIDGAVACHGGTTPHPVQDLFGTP